MMNNKQIGVVSASLNDFKQWCEERRFKIYSKAFCLYIDKEGEMYYPVTKKDDCFGIRFDNVEVSNDYLKNTKLHNLALSRLKG